jgi:hypothetical protein
VTVGGTPSSVPVIDTLTNKVVATVGTGHDARVIGIVPPPPGVPFLTMSASAALHFGGGTYQDAFTFHSNFTLSSTDSDGIKPATEAVTVQVSTFTTTIPPGSFKKQPDGSFAFNGTINGVSLQSTIKPAGTLRYAFFAAGRAPMWRAP